MLLSEILDAHHDPSLPRDERIINDLNVGDAFLYQHHPFYRNLRDAFWDLGYRFDTNDFCNLFEVPLFSLDLMLKERRVPVRDTVSPLDALVQRFPGALFTDLSFNVELAYPVNHILHHMAHCVAEDVTARLMGSGGYSAREVLRIVICEAFGNTIDLLSNVDAHRLSEEGRSLFIMNNLVSKEAAEIAPYAALVERVGWKAAVQVIALFFLFRNLLAESIDAEFLRDACDRFGVDIADVEPVLPLFETTTLTFGFLIATNTRYFKYLGFAFTDLLELYDFDLLQMVDEHPGIREAWDVMADVIVGNTVLKAQSLKVSESQSLRVSKSHPPSLRL